MGDHRAEIHITLSLHGKTYKADWDWKNYCCDSDGVDYDVRQFFQDSWEDARARYEEQVARSREEEERPKREAAERKEFLRLKAKYEPPPPIQAIAGEVKERPPLIIDDR